jgi:hypothetical protein
MKEMFKHFLQFVPSVLEPVRRLAVPVKELECVLSIHGRNKLRKQVSHDFGIANEFGRSNHAIDPVEDLSKFVPLTIAESAFWRLPSKP